MLWFCGDLSRHCTRRARCGRRDRDTYISYLYCQLACHPVSTCSQVFLREFMLVLPFVSDYVDLYGGSLDCYTLPYIHLHTVVESHIVVVYIALSYYYPPVTHSHTHTLVDPATASTFHFSYHVLYPSSPHILGRE